MIEKKISTLQFVEDNKDNLSDYLGRQAKGLFLEMREVVSGALDKSRLVLTLLNAVVEGF